MLNSKSKKIMTVFTTYDLCLDCDKGCKHSGPPWRRLECPSFSSTEIKYKVYRIVDMTDSELIKRIAYA